MNTNAHTRPFRCALSILAVTCAMLFASASANAACGDLGGLNTKPSIKLPMLFGATPSDAQNTDSIVGLWHVIYTADGGAKFNESLDQWHSDGTEFENAYLPVAAGNICFGVWKQVGVRTVRLRHVGFTYNSPGLASGAFTIDATDTVSADGKTYTGTFDFKVYDLEGNFLEGSEVKGTLLATRITVS
jgi:hypothetical protein